MFDLELLLHHPQEFLVYTVFWWNTLKNIKGAAKLYFKRYSRVVIILSNTGLPGSAFSNNSFGKLVLVVFLCFLCFLLVLCFEFNATICIILIYISDFTELWKYKNLMTKIRLSLIVKIRLPERFWAFFEKMQL